MLRRQYLINISWYDLQWWLCWWNFENIQKHPKADIPNLFSLQDPSDLPSGRAHGRVVQHEVCRVEGSGSLDLHLGCLQSFGVLLSIYLVLNFPEIPFNLVWVFGCNWWILNYILLYSTTTDWDAPCSKNQDPLLCKQADMPKYVFVKPVLLTHLPNRSGPASEGEETPSSLGTTLVLTPEPRKSSLAGKWWHVMT